jgi:general secretion pathway protein D
MTEHTRRLSRWGFAIGSVLAVLTLASPAQAQERPRDDVMLDVAYNADFDYEASNILALWARNFNALVVQDPQIQQIRIRFITSVNQLSWGMIKTIFDFYDIVIVESQPSPGGPWVIRAHHRRNLAQKEGPPWRYVEGEAEIPDHEEIVTAVFQVENGAGNAIFATVRGLLTRDTNRIGNILYVQGPEVIIIVDLASRVRYYHSVIAALDVAGPRRQMEIYQISHAPVQDLASILTTVLTSLGGSTGAPGQPVVVQPGGGAGGGSAQVMPDPRSNQLIVAAFPVDFPTIERVIAALDVRVAPPSGRFHVYKCKDADAEDLAGRIQELFTGQRPATAGTAGGTPTPAGGTGAVSLGEGGGVGDVETRIIADERTNSLLIQAEDRAYEEILSVLSELDKKRWRVMIEAEIWEISVPTDQLNLGFELATVTNAHDGSLRPAAASGFGLSQINPIMDDQGNTTGLSRIPSFANGVTAVLTKDTFDQLPIIMTAVHNYEESRLITRPFALTNDNTPTTFAVSDRQPFLTTTVNNVASQQNVQFVDANSTLTVEPQVNSEDNLTLNLTLEITSFSGQGSANLPPGTNSRRYEGEVTIPNNRYIVFGGLERESESIVESKVPWLGDIPILGHLFKTWSRTRTRTRLYIFIRPTIFSDPEFTQETRVTSAMRERAHVESARDEWLPPVIPDRFMRPAGYTLQDESFEVFGTGSGDPFRGGLPLGQEGEDDE